MTGVLLFLLLSQARSVQAQEQSDTTTEEVTDAETNTDENSQNNSALPSEDYTGTLDEEEDPDNPNYEKRQIENEVFGTDKDDSASDDDTVDTSASDSEVPNTLMRFTFDSQVLITNDKGETYMQISYTTKIEQEIVLTNHRWRGTAEADITSDVIGNLAGNDLFTCKLDMNIAPVAINLMTLLKTVQTNDTPNGDTQDTQQVAIQIEVDNDYKEDVYSNCNSGENTFNTQGDPEKYNLTILQNTAPSLNGITLDRFDSAGSQIDIVTDPIEIDDMDLNETITMSGSGTLSLEPFR